MAFEIVENMKTRTEFVSQDLTLAVNRINTYKDNIVLNTFKIAAELRRIQEFEMYKADGFKNISEFSKEVFGFSTAFTGKLTKIARNFLDKEGNTILKNEYTPSQLSELLPLPKDTVLEMDKEGDISPDNTVKELREKVKEAREKKNEVTAERAKKVENTPILNVQFTENSMGRIEISLQYNNTYLGEKFVEGTFHETGEIYDEKLDLIRYTISSVNYDTRNEKIKVLEKFVEWAEKRVAEEHENYKKMLEEYNNLVNQNEENTDEN